MTGRFHIDRLSPGARLIASNLVWLVFDRILRLFLTVVIAVLVARYLGPAQFGQLSYAIAFVGLFAFLGGLGLQGVVVRELVRRVDETASLIGTSVLMQLIAGALAMAASIAFIAYVRPGDAEIRLIVIALSGMLLLRSAEGFKYWFEASVQSKYTIVVENVVLAMTAAAKLFAINFGAPLMTFVWITLVEAALFSIGYYLAYGRKVGWKLLSVEWVRARQLLIDSWPLMMSALAITLYMRIDQVMIGEMLGDESVGYFSAAVRITEVLYMLPTAICQSLFPMITRLRDTDIRLYHRRLRQMYSALFWVSVALAIFVTLFAGPIVQMLYGAKFDGAVAVLKVQVWALVFVSLGVASASWILNENKSMFAMVRNLAGAIINIALNLLLIPRFGIMGAAMASLAAYATAFLFIDLLGAPFSFRMKLRSIFLPLSRD